MPKSQTLEYYRSDDNGGWDNSCPIGASDIAPGMLNKLRNHDLDQYRTYAIQVRVRKTGQVVQTIPACTGTSGECCPHCCQHTPRHT